MDEQRFLTASQLRDQGNLAEAAQEFIRLAEDTDDPIDKAGILVNAASTFRALREYDRARRQLSAARTIAPALGDVDDRVPQLHVCMDLEEADICRYESKNEEALTKLNNLLVKYRQWLTRPDFRDFYEMVQTRRAFLLADIGRWKEALPILQEGRHFKEHREGIAFYLGHCHVCAREYASAKEKLVESLKLGLPPHLEYRAHNELGIAHFALGAYAQAKAEFEKTIELADPAYLRDGQIWKRLEVSCRQLGLEDQADQYASKEKHRKSER